MKDKMGILIAGAQGANLVARQTAFAEAFRQQRMKQNALDRTEALRSLDPAKWQIFSLRWNLPPPFPKGWGDIDAQLAVMHKVRLMLPDFTDEERVFSAAWLVGHGMDLPEGLTFEEGKLKGVAHGPGPVRR
jgi:hypothetical protein